MRVVVLSPTPPYRSGLSHYVLYLYSNFSNSHIVYIITNKDSNATPPSSNVVISRTFTPGISAPWTCLRSILIRDPDVLHIHVEYAFLGSWLNLLLLPFFMIILKFMCRSKIVMTLHGIPNIRSLYYYLRRILKIPAVVSGPLGLMYSALSYVSVCISCILSDAVIVHTGLMREALASFIPRKVLRKVHVIAHGSYEPVSIENPGGDRDHIIILTIGYQRPSKGIKTLLRAGREISRYISNVEFMIVGRRIQRIIEKEEKIKSCNVGVRIKIVDDFLEDKALDDIIRKAEIIVLPYEDLFYEASGALHRVALFRKPLVCSNIPRFSSSLTNGVDSLLFPAGNHIKLSNCISKLINNRVFAEQLSMRLAEKFSHTTWRLIARKHEQLFLAMIQE